ncbi:MAG: hypothetical protein Q4B54_10430 [Coriobacteriales bacterium]|nr:hypothetical protein [Coriobacteriales bacterium]
MSQQPMPQQILAMTQSQGFELSEEQLDQISGGSWEEGETATCPSCHTSTNVEPIYGDFNRIKGFHCKSCNCTWEANVG